MDKLIGLLKIHKLCADKSIRGNMVVSREKRDSSLPGMLPWVHYYQYATVPSN